MIGKRIRVGLIILVAVVLLSSSGFVIWANAAPAPMPEAILSLSSDSEVSVNEGPWLAFEPVPAASPVGLIFYPGGRVDARAYAPAIHEIARNGFLAVIVPMPLNLAVFAPDRAVEVIAAYPEVSRWVLAGHSLGGAMAARFAYENPETLAGLALWAAYPASSNNLVNLDLPVLSIYGTLDGLASQAEVDASRGLLPADTVWLPIVGGNHAQFGWYGVQAGDNPAEISRVAQQAQIVTGMVQFMRELEPTAP